MSSLLELLAVLVEESLDIAGKDTSERLGVVRLRKVQQKTIRWQHAARQGEMIALRAIPHLGKPREL